MREVEHIYPTRDGSLCELVSEALGLSSSDVEELLTLGAVWHSPVAPLPPLHRRQFLPDTQLRAIMEAREAAKAAGLPKACFQGKAKRTLEDIFVSAGSYIRVHTSPKRFPAAQEIDWTSRVLHLGPQFLVADKAAGVQCTPSEDNVVDCLPACMEKALGLASPLIPTHRLDEGTEGVVVIARTPEFASYFQTLLKRVAGEPSLVRKLYRCLTASAPPLGRLRHDVHIGHRFRGSPKYTAILPMRHGGNDDGNPKTSKASGDFGGGAVSFGRQSCTLEVLRIHHLDPNHLGPQVLADNSLADGAYEVTVLLHTGRTHQIRAQMAAVDCPLVGDRLYSALHRLGAVHQPDASSLSEPSHETTDVGDAVFHTGRAPVRDDDSARPSSHAGHDRPCLQPQSQGSGPFGKAPPMAARIDWQSLLGEPGRTRVALQAFRLEVHDPGEEGLRMMGSSCPVVFDAGAPWWRTQGQK